MSKFKVLFRMIKKRDPLLRFFLLQKIGALLMPSYRFHWPQLSWWHNSIFNKYLERFDETHKNNTYRHWMLSELLKLVSELPGDSAECGVFKGASSFLICKGNLITSPNNVHHIFDSFKGLSEPTITDGSFWTFGDLACSLDEVKLNLAEFGESRLQFHPGWIPEKFVNIQKIYFRFVHIDVDLYEPTRDSLTFFYERMISGGIILCDDYGFTSCPGATKAFDDFFIGKPEQIISLPCGGCFVIKK
ncbi:Macrocin-O-methyltransferase [Candidatus Methylopumilus universalis]|uniref:TylF/MycF/NovP-related O-methyltransferase n=1 Tax=Candidatus Methylopumilus universalis TaxID=2588536 RepID=UPI003BEEEC18